MSNFQSYSSYVPQEAEQHFTSGPQIRQDAPVHRVTSAGGNLTESTEQVDRGHSGQINPANGTNTWQATATTTTGRAVSQITADSLVTIGGIQGKVSFFVGEGILQQGADGTFTEGSGPVEAPQVNEGEHFPISDGAMSVVNAALEPLPDHAVDVVTAQGIGVALGRLDDASLTAKFSQATGLDLAASHDRLTTIKAIYQEQADKALESHYGISAADKAAFYAWAKANRGGQLQEAVGKQLRGHDVSGYKALADQWLSQTAPSINAIKAAGIPVRGQEIFVQGIWMSPASAARAGLI